MERIRNEGLHSSLDWDSPSAKTGTVKRRPNSEDEAGPTFSLFCNVSQDALTASTTSSCSTVSTTSSRDDRTYDNYAQVYDHLPLYTHKSARKGEERWFKQNMERDSYNNRRCKIPGNKTGLASLQKLPQLRQSPAGRDYADDGNSDKQCKIKTFAFSPTSPYDVGVSSAVAVQRIISPGKVSDTDSGIASPLSPSSLNFAEFLGYSEKSDFDHIIGNNSIGASKRGLKSGSKFSSNLAGLPNLSSGLKKRMDHQQSKSYDDLQRQDVDELLTDEKIYTDWANHYLEKARSKKRVNSLAADCSDGVLLAEVIESVMCQKIPDINRKPKTPSQMLDNINLCLSALRTQHVAGVESVSGQDLRDGRLKAILALFFALSRHKQAAKQRAAVHQPPPTNAAASQQEQMTPNRSAIPHKGGSSIPMPGSALPSRRCPPDKVRPVVAGSSRATSPALSMIPRGPPAATVTSPYQQPPAKNTSMLDKLKLFKSDRPHPTPASNGKRTSSSSGVSSARSERSDSSISLEPAEIKPVRNASRLKQQRPAKTTTSTGKNSPQSNKKDLKRCDEREEKDKKKVSVDVEKHATKVASIETRSKLVEPKVKVKDKEKHDRHMYVTPIGTPPPATGQATGPGTGIPKPTAAIKGTTKVPRGVDDRKGISRETSATNLQPPLQPKTIGVVSPIKNEKDSIVDRLTESVHSDQSVGTTGGLHSNSSESSVIYKPSSESSCDIGNIPNGAVIPNRKETLEYITEAPILQELNPFNQPRPPKSEVKLVQNEEKPLNTGQPTQVYNISVNHKHTSLQSIQNNLQNIPGNLMKEVSATQDEEMNVEPMRPLYRGYCSTLTLPSRGVSRYPGGRVPDMGGMNGDYCEVSIANGYLSDGEILRNGSHNHHQMAAHHQNGELDGYMSEGGSALYARRLQTMPAMSMNVPNGAPRISPSLTVLAEQTAVAGGGARRSRGAADEPPPPPTGPRQHRGQHPRSNGSPSQFPPDKHHHSSASGQQWKRYTDSPGVGSPPPPPPPAPSSPTSARRDRERRSSPHGGGSSASSAASGVNGPTNGSGGAASKDKKVRGVPQSFGYVKRSSTSTSTSTTTPTNGHHVANGGGGGVNGMGSPPSTLLPNGNGKTAQVSAVPRTKVKVSGGTQTCSSDLQPHKAAQFKSYSLTGNAATQLSQSVRERLMGSQSLPKGAAQEYSLMLRQRPPKASDGSLSDTQAVEAGSPYAPWLRHSNTYSVAPRLSETDSMESLTSLPGHRGSLTHARLLRDSPSRLSRSNSIRSTKSEKLYPSMLHRNNTEPESEPYYCLPVNAVLHWSQPTSPAPGTARTFPLSPTHSNARHSVPKNDEVHGSSISLVSTASSIYSSAEEKQAHEIRKLRRELIDAQDKVHTLTSQLSTNAHVVSAFEQSLSSMTQRLQNITATSEKKDSELSELKAAMESLRAQSLQAGIGTGLARQPSSDSVSSLSSACSLDKQDKKKKKGWLRSSFTKAFSRNAKVTKVQCQNDTNGENDRHASPPPQQPAVDQGQEVQELQKQLREKDLVLTDIRLEALTSAHQLESLKDTVMKMRSEMLSLKQNNERLQRMVSGSVGNIPAAVITSNSMDPLSDLIPTEELPAEAESDGKRITISVYLGQPTTFQKYYAEHYEDDGDGSHATTEIAIALTTVGAATSWGQLDNAVRRAFKQHVARLDPGGGLGLGSDSVALYKLGEAERASDSAPPDLLPVGYVIGRVNTLHVVLQPVAALSFEALIPKGVAQRLVSLLAEHRRLVLCGAPGTGKTHLATRLAEFHAQSLGRDPAEAVATFNVDNKSAKELRQYLSHLSEQAATGDNSMLPCVVVLDNLHKAGPLADALGSLPRNLPCLIGTMAQSACSATSLQLQHGFRWVLVAPHMEPARGLLGRVLRRRLATLELDQGPQPELAAILGWLPRVWQHLNAFLETHSSGDVAIGPRLFLSCPLELDAARAWFADVWNYSLAPYLREAAREGLQLYGRRAAWSDPTQFVLDTYPWPGAPPQGLTSIPAKDVGLEAGPTAQAENDGDPLLNMLMRLQEAANYSSPHSNDSDCNSLDSNLTHNNLGTESVS